MIMHIAITGNLGSGKSTVARKLSEKLGFPIYSTGDVQRRKANELGITTLELNRRSMEDPALDHYIDDDVVRESVEKDNIIFDSRMAWHFAHNAFRVFIKVDINEAARRIQGDKRGNVESFKTVEEAKASVSERGRLERERFVSIYGVDYADEGNYDLVLDSTNHTPDEITDMIIAAFDKANTPSAVTVYTEKAPAAIGPYSQAKLLGSVLYTSGQIPIDPATGAVTGEGIVEQTHQVCKNIKAVLHEARTSFAKVVKTTCFLADMSDFAAFNEVYEQYFVSKPARSCVAVKTLPKNVLVEIEVIAEV